MTAPASAAVAAPPIRPFALGPFLVAPDGVLSAGPAAASPRFSFTWRRRGFEVELRGRHLWISAPIAGLPLSAGRPAVLDALLAVRAALEPGWRLAMSPGAVAVLEAEVVLPRPVTAARLVAEAARFAWQVSPCLDLLDEAGALVR
jgi:hypothetical protein